MRLTFQLRHGVKWHDGQPFTAKDVVCTYDLRMGKAPEKLRLNPGLSSFKNLDHLTTEGDFEVTFHLKRPQPAFLMLISGGPGAIYPCHVSPEKMRRQPIGTGPFKFVEYKAHQYIRCATRTTGSRAGPTSTASNTPSGRTWRRRRWASPRARST